MKKAGGGFKRPSMSKPSSSPKRPSPFKSSFKIGRKAPSMEGGPKASPGFGGTGGWRSRPRGGCFGSIIGLILVLVCIGVIVGAFLLFPAIRAVLGG